MNPLKVIILTIIKFYKTYYVIIYLLTRPNIILYYIAATVTNPTKIILPLEVYKGNTLGYVGYK